MLALKGRSEKPCVICKKPNTRLAEDKEAEFKGALCKEHVWEMTDVEAPKKNGKTNAKQACVE